MMSIAIQHAPFAADRAQNVRALRAALPCAVVVEDNGRGAWLTSVEAWRRATGTHHLVLQDDAVLCPDFLARAEQAIATVPDNAWSFFAPHGAGTYHSLTMVATCLPVDVARRYVAEVTNKPQVCDAWLAMWLRRESIPRHFVPLVEHGRFPSLIKRAA